jgi:hypothetical protein
MAIVKSVFSESEFEFNCKLSLNYNYRTMSGIAVTCEGIAELEFIKVAGTDKSK